MTARRQGARRGRPVEIPEILIVAIREALGRGEPAATVAKAWGVSARYVRNLRAGERRPEAVEIPPELQAVEGEYGEGLREIWRLLKGAAR